MFKKLFKFFPVLIMAICGLASCNNEKEDLGPFIDYVHDGSVSLTHDYVGHDFLADGIGQVSLKTAIDGDTAHFYSKEGRGVIKSRFLGIDTPESTGKVQPYGKAASNFTKEKLKEADKNGTIVVSSSFEEYKPAQADSTGERYLSLIWINTEKKNAPIDELYLLNLWIVQEGLSWVKNILDMPDYADTFYSAEEQAKKFGKNLHSEQPDPDFPTDEYEVISLLELKRDNVSSIVDKDYVTKYNNKRVSLTGTVAGYANKILYLTDFFDEEESGTKGGEYAGVNIFTGMSPISSSYKVPGTYIQLFGLVQITENYGFQVTDVEGRFNLYGYDVYDVKILKTADETKGTEHDLHTFEYKASELDTLITNNKFDALNGFVKITDEVVVDHFYISGKEEITLGFKGHKFGAFITFTYEGDPNDSSIQFNTKEQFVGQKFEISGILASHKTEKGYKFQLIPCNKTQILWKGSAE